jgi:hypothetical protein
MSDIIVAAMEAEAAQAEAEAAIAAAAIEQVAQQSGTEATVGPKPQVSPLTSSSGERY